MTWTGSILIDGIVTEFVYDNRDAVVANAAAILLASGVDDGQFHVPILLDNAPGVGYSVWLTKIGMAVVSAKCSCGKPKVFR